MSVHLTTLGGFRVGRDGDDLVWLPARRLRAGLLAYLAVERCVSREALSAVFWPESTTENARHALRQCLYHLRRDLGDDWLEVRGHDLVASAAVHADVHDFTTALERGNAAAAARLYGGPFMDGVNLLDLQPWESWVEGRRTQYARAFRKACREWVDGLAAAGDLHGAIEAAQRWTGADPLDDEAQHRLIETLAAAGERTSAIRQYASYARLLDAEGLHPLDATTALIEQLRSERPPATPAAVHAGGRAEHVVTPQPSASRKRRMPLAIGAAATLLLIAFAAIWVLDPGNPAPSSTDVAVFPFTVRGGPQHLGAGMITLLGTALDGATVRPVDGRAVLGVVAQDPPGVLDPERAASLARRLGAGLYVLGDLVEAGDRVQIEAAVYRTGTSNEPVAHGSVTGETERLFDLVDRLAAQLLAGVGGAPDDRLTRTAAATTASLAAFKDYLQGDAELRAGRFERGIDAYRRAIERDSTFAIAHYRLALARDWAAYAGSEEAARAATRHAMRLAPRDRAHLDAFLAYTAGDALEAERRYTTILARYPEDLEAWFQLAEIRFHYGTPRARPIAGAQQAWRNVLAYEPRSVSAVLHLARIAAADGRVATLDSLLAPFAPDERLSDRRLVQVGALRAIAARDSAGLSALIERARGWEDAAAWQLAAYLTAFGNDPGGVRRALQPLIEPRRPHGMIADLHWFTALIHLESGELGDARRALADALAANATISLPWYRRTYALVTEWWLATLPLPYPDSMLQRVRRTAMSAALPTRAEVAGSGEGVPIWYELLGDALGANGRLEALRLYAVGHLSLRLGDAPQAELASAALARIAADVSADAAVRSLERELRARCAWNDGDPARALRILENDAPEFVSVGATTVVPFLAHAQQRYLHGELLVALGRDAEALPWFASIGRLSVPEVALRAAARLRQAEIHERLGNRHEADRLHAEVRRLSGP